MADGLESVRGILRETRNFWRREGAERIAFLIDASNYFTAFRAAALRAERRILIVGWEIHSRTRLVMGEPEDGLPADLGPFLTALLTRRPRLNVHILIWDYAVVYAVEREIMPLLNPHWTSHPRMSFRLDSDHPLGASQHQKMVVIDDKLAFVGGTDLTMRRWDMPEHKPLDPRRRDPDGRPYPPFHDVEMMVDGAAARAVATLASERWHHATGQQLRFQRAAGDPWPPLVRPDLEHCRVAIARTCPTHQQRSDVREVEHLWEDAIGAAHRSIYIEQQYLTAEVIRDALMRRLAEEDGPDIVIVLPRFPHGLLEQAVLADAQMHTICRLQLADIHGRLRIYYPMLPGEEPEDERWVRVHAKILVIDDRLVRVGSSNASNRSMGVDSECDLAAEADSPVTAAGIARFRNQLLAEHLGCTLEAVEVACADASLIGAIERLSRPEGRHLAPISLTSALEASMPRDQDTLDANLFDPKYPIRPDRLIEDFFPEARPRHHISRRFALSILCLAIMLAVAGLWAFTPFRDEVSSEALFDGIEQLRGGFWTPLWVIGGFIVGNLLFVPVTVLITVSGLVFGPALGFAYAMLGSLASASVGFLLGRLVGSDRVGLLSGKRIERISRRLRRSGILAIAVVRLLPVAPFVLVNMAAGAIHVRYRDYLIGSVLGLLPGIVSMTSLGVGMERIVRTRDATSAILFCALVAGLGFAGWALQRWLGMSGKAPPLPAGGHCRGAHAAGGEGRGELN